MRKSKPSTPRIALALAGGGPLGAIYEIGALCALEESLEGLDLGALDHYVGVSAGGFIAAGLANGMTARELCAAFIENDDGACEVFDPAWLMVPAWGEFLRRGVMLPGLAASAAWRATFGRKTVTQLLEGLGRSLPTGVFSNEEVDRRLTKLFTQPGRTNDFRQLRSRLTLVATDLDTGDAAPFGRPGFDDVSISRAVQASSALPGLFPPVQIGERYYVDGALKKTLHATVALDEGVDLLLCLNPLVPFNAIDPHEAALRSGATGERRSIPRIVEGGLPAVLSQTFRSMIHSRMELGLKHYERAYPGTDIVLVEPDNRDPELYLANTFSYRQRRELAEHAYQQTRTLLRSRRTTLGEKFARHGITFNEQVLQDQRRHLVAARKPRHRLGAAMATLHEVIDDLQQWVPAEAERAAKAA